MPYYKNGKKYYTKAEKAEYAKRMSAKNRIPVVTARRRPVARKVQAKSRYTAGTAGQIAGSAIGGFLGGPAGASIGGVIGKGAHQLFKHITGFGDYKIEANSLMLGGMSPPEIINSTNNGGFIVRHREYIGDVTATVDFTVTAYDINPGVMSTFPWLGSIASSFEEYSMRGLIFEFKSMSSDAVLSSATSSALGSVVMATDYNVLGPNFPNKMQMENYEFANSSKPSCSFIHPVECKKSLSPVSNLYVRADIPPAGSDQRLYDLGKFQIATVGMQASGGVVGELWCTYEVELLKPRFTLEEIESQDHFRILSGVAGGVPLGLTQSTCQGSNIGGTLNQTLQRYEFPASAEIGNKYLVSYSNFGTVGVAITAPTITVGSGLSIVNAFGGGTYSVLSAPANGLSTANFLQEFVVSIDNPTNRYISFGIAGTVPNGNACDFVVTKCNDNYSAT